MMTRDKRRIDVMVSSTTNDLGEHRRRLSQIITNLLLTPRMMDNDSATGKDGLTYSLSLVDEAEIYILLLGFRYGHVPDDPRNPECLSMTHLEYRRAKERQKRDGMCVLAFLVDDALKPEIVRPELTAFRDEVQKDQIKYFKSIDELCLLVQQALAQSPCVKHAPATDKDNAEPMLEANIDKHLQKLEDSLPLQGVVYEKLFVNMEGDIQTILERIKPTNAAYHDRMLSDFEDLLDRLLVEQEADHHVPQEAQPRHVTNIIDKLLENACARVVLVGEPGSGKTFTLRRLVMAYIRAYPNRRLVPVFVPLNAFKGEIRFSDYIRAQMDTLAPYYEELRDKGRLVLICDALNEMPRVAITDGRELLDEVRRELMQAPRFVVSCRVRDYKHDLDSLKLERLEVRDLDLPAIRELIRRYSLLLEYDDAELWERIGGSEELLAFWEKVREEGEPERFWQEDAGVPRYTSVASDTAWRKMWQGAKLIPLSRNPYLARVICSLHGKAKMPENRAELYAAFVTDLYERECEHARQRGQSFPERERLEDFLTTLANLMQEAQTTVLKAESVTDSDLLGAALDASILTQDGNNLRFSHQLLQEYFAAKILAQKLYADEPPVLENWWAKNVWRETFLMLAEFVDDKARAIQWLGRSNPELAYETWERLMPDTPVDAATREALIASAHDKTAETNPLGRAAAYRALGIFDADKRPGVNVILRDGVRLPDVDWVRIPAGEFTYQDEKMTLNYDFHIARYPITYIQFQTFLDDPAGFRNPEWWRDLADVEAQHRNQREADEQEFKYWNHPRERVSWYDAMAFCRWLSARLGFEVRLPTEFEWEKAARANTGWQYPWGDDYRTGYANIDETDGQAGEYYLNRTSAVGIYPAGNTPHWEKPISDLSGNVWEWCLTEHKNPQVDARKENISYYDIIILCGGSWFDALDDARAVSRIVSSPDFRLNDYGFRVLRP